MISAAARGSWRELESKLRPFIARRLSATADVDDVVQDVFLRMQRGLGELRDQERFGPWVYKVAHNAIIDHQRATAKRRLVDTIADDDDLPPMTDHGDVVEQLVASYIAPFIKLLASPYSEALTLTELQGLTQKEAALHLGISVSGMKSRVQRGRLLLRQALEECCSIALDRRGNIVACEPRPDGRLPNGAAMGSFGSACCSMG